jgi:hypothetical protein
VLGSSRGGFELDKIFDGIQRLGVGMLFVIGGDGTHKGALAISDEAKRRKLVLTVVGVPKTIDNDILILDKTFGFTTAVEESVKAVTCAKVEAKCAPYGIGIVRLMGRYAVRAHANRLSQLRGSSPRTQLSRPATWTSASSPRSPLRPRGRMGCSSTCAGCFTSAATA